MSNILSIPVLPQLWDTNILFTEYAQNYWLKSQTSVRQPMVKLFGSSPSRLEFQTSVRRLTLKLFGSILSRLDSRTSVRRPTLKLFGLIPSQLDSWTSVHRPTLKLFGSSPIHLSFDRSRNCWLTSQTSVLRPSQPLITHVLDVCPTTVTETKMSPIVCTSQN